MSVAPFGVLLWLLSCTSKKVTPRPLSRRSAINPATRSVAKACASSNPARRRRRQPQAPATRSVAPPPQAASGTLARDAFFLAKSTPLAAARQFTPPKIRFYGKGVPRFAKRGQRPCLWNPQPLKRLAKLLVHYKVRYQTKVLLDFLKKIAGPPPRARGGTPDWTPGARLRSAFLR